MWCGVVVVVWRVVWCGGDGGVACGVVVMVVLVW